MERIDSILSLVSRTGAKLGVIKHTSKPKSFNSIICGGHHHPSSRDIKDKNRVLWVLMDEKNREIKDQEEHIFPWEEEKNHSEKESEQQHNLNINLKVHGDLNDQVEHPNRNKFLSADWTSRGHSTYWKLSMLWDGETRGVEE